MKTQENILQISVGGRKKICPADIILMEGEINYSRLFLVDGQTIFVATTLKTLSEKLENYNFFRTHKSFLINLNYVESFEENCFLKMKNQSCVSVSRRRKTLLKTAISNFSVV